MAAPCQWTLRLCTQSFGVNVKVAARNFGISCLHLRNGCVSKRQNVQKLLRAVSDRGYRKLMSENACAKFILPVAKCKIGGFTGPCTSKLEHFIPRSSDVVRVYSSQKKDKQKFEDVEPKENVLTIPNLLTLSRIALTPVIGYLVIQESFTLALGIFTFAGITDLLDGFIARNFKNQRSTLGTALDPLADKILMTVLTATLSMAGLLPVPLTVLIIGRDVLLVVTGFVIRYISLPPPKTFKRYFDVTNPTAKLMPSTLSKVNTALQLGLVCFTLAAPVFEFVNHPALQGLWYLTAATTFGSGIGYVINRKKAVKFLKNGKEDPF